MTTKTVKRQSEDLKGKVISQKSLPAETDKNGNLIVKVLKSYSTGKNYTDTVKISKADVAKLKTIKDLQQFRNVLRTAGYCEPDKLACNSRSIKLNLAHANSKDRLACFNPIAKALDLPFHVTYGQRKAKVEAKAKKPRKKATKKTTAKK